MALSQQKSLAVLKSLGFTFRQWLGLFFWLGNYLALLCIGLGLILGITLAYGLNPIILYLEKIKKPTTKDAFNAYQNYGLPIEWLKKNIKNFKEIEFDNGK